MKLYSDIVAHGFALMIAIATLALAVEFNQDVKAPPPERPGQNQIVKESRQERKDLATERKRRRAEWRERQTGKPKIKVTS